jgi:hypothetical protein
MPKQSAVEAPPVNVYEADDQLTVAIPMPGAHHDTVAVLTVSLPIGDEPAAQRTRIPVTEPLTHQGQPH